MKLQFYFILFCTAILYAQPGDKFGYFRTLEVPRITDSIAKYPNDYRLRWVRTELLFNPYFTFYTTPQQFKHHTTAIDRAQNLAALTYQDYNVLDDLNLLIANGNSFNIDPTSYPYIGSSPDGEQIGLANFYYKRGQYYFLMNNREQALTDYLNALNYHPGPYLRERICISIAGYYYSRHKTPTKNDLELALTYIDLTIPVIYEKQPRVITRFGDHNFDRFEREKIMLLIATENDDRLFNYLKNLSKSHFNFYVKQLNELKTTEDRNSYYITQSLATGMDYLERLFKHIGAFKHPERYTHLIKQFADSL